MPFVAEFTTNGRSKILNSGHAPEDDKDAIEKFEKQAIAMAEARQHTRYTCRCYILAASCIPKANRSVIQFDEVVSNLGPNGFFQGLIGRRR